MTVGAVSIAMTAIAVICSVQLILSITILVILLGRMRGE